ncbi:MAG: 16S rRNA (cytosine(1402)-N(4))-methyltransferase RsmH [bacterium]|nr:16S rRNA (cytosine(1402)-N(4))-methyltransferase RsmH [bacterium]
MDQYHIPVMLKEVFEYLNVRKGSWYIDCTLGGGGHTEEILKRGGNVLGIDQDPEAISKVAKKYNLQVTNKEDHLQVVSENLILYQDNFTHLKEIVGMFSKTEIYGIFFDLGVSSHQFDETNRGFSFSKEAPLDMRMSPEMKVTAADLVNGLHEKEMAELFLKYGEEPFAKAIAKKIVEERERKKITTTNQLSQIISSVKYRTHNSIHPATLVFQALRIAVNDELNNLREALPQAVEVLRPGGRLIAVSFHSLEDRIVKNFFKYEQQKSSITILTHKPLVPTEEEINQNPRARSSKLRAAEKNS